MPHDKRGEELRVGDTVMVPCVIKAIHLTEQFCNIDLETKLTMPPSNTTSALTLNSRQTIKPTATHRFMDYPDAAPPDERPTLAVLTRAGQDADRAIKRGDWAGASLILETAINEYLAAAPISEPPQETD